MKEVTDEWVSVMSKPENQTGVCARLAAMGELPVGVELADPRVRRVLKRIRERCQEEYGDEQKG